MPTPDATPDTPASEAATPPAGTPAVAPPAPDTAATDTSAAKPADAAASEGKQAAPEDTKAPLELKLPDGFIAGPEFEEFKALADETGMTGESAQKLVDLYAKAQGSVLERSDAAFKAAVEAWKGEVKADKEIGGADVDKNLVLARNALRQFGTPELSAALDQSGLGDHPEIVRLLVRVARATSEDSVAGRTGGSAPEVSEESFLRSRYPTMFPG